MSALAADHRNDVVATIVALVFGIIGTILNEKAKKNVLFFIQFLFFLGSKAIDGEIKPKELAVIDPVGMYQIFFLNIILINISFFRCNSYQFIYYYLLDSSSSSYVFHSS